jgi:lipopolysaccharide export LptBFGC system permease protein LptF
MIPESVCRDLRLEAQAGPPYIMPTLQSKVAYSTDRLPYQLIRALWYVVAESTVVLIVATLSRRLVFANEAWALMLPGILTGLLLALVAGLLRRVEVEPFPQAFLVPASMFAAAFGMCMVLGVVVPDLSLGLMGSLVVGISGSLVGLVPYAVFDAPDGSIDG